MPRTSTKAILAAKRSEQAYRLEDQVGFLLRRAYHRASSNLIERIGALNGSPPVVGYGPWRIGDQRWYVSNPGKFQRATGWRPKTNIGSGLRRLHEWLSLNRRAAPAVQVTGT